MPQDMKPQVDPAAQAAPAAPVDPEAAFVNMAESVAGFGQALASAPNVPPEKMKIVQEIMGLVQSLQAPEQEEGAMPMPKDVPMEGGMGGVPMGPQGMPRA